MLVIAVMPWGKHGLDAGHIVEFSKHTGHVCLSENPSCFYSMIVLWHFIPGSAAILYALFLMTKK